MNLSSAQLMALVFARALRDGDTVVMGTNAAIPATATHIARAHGKKVRTLIGATGTLDPHTKLVPASGADQAFLPGRAVLGLATGVRDQLRGYADVIFLGGLQVDRRARINLCCVGDYQRPRLRGPGSIGLSLAATIPRVFLFFENHDLRVFVEAVDFVSADPLAAGGEVLVATPLGVFGAEAGARELGLVSVHPGATVEDIQSATGFSLGTRAAPMTPRAGAQEIAALEASAEGRALGGQREPPPE